MQTSSSHHHPIPSAMFQASEMYSTTPLPPSFFFRGAAEQNEEEEEEEEEGRVQTRFGDIGELDHHHHHHHPSPLPAFHHNHAFDLSPRNVNAIVPSSSSSLLLPSLLNTSIGCLDTGQQQYMYGKGTTSFGNNWGDSNSGGMAADTTDTSTDVDTTDERHHHHHHHQQLGGQHGSVVVVDSIDQSNCKVDDQKTIRRLAQNREAARKSRLRKKAYVQQLENSRLKLTQLEQELQRARQQGNDHGHSVAGNDALAFDMDYQRWLGEHQRLINDLRSAANSPMEDNKLRVLVDGVMSHYVEIFRLKSIAAKADVFHILSGLWKTPAERCFMWIGGFRSSELLKIVVNQLEPLTDQQLVGICNLQQSSQQAEDALSQGMEALQQSLVDSLSSASLRSGACGFNVADYMAQMAIAMSKLTTLENFLHQADLLRQQTLQQLHRILTTRQAANALLVISDYTSRLRALSSLWSARPRN